MLRDSEGGPQVLVTVRPQSMRFMGGATVFPGGAVAASDLDPRWEGASSLSAAGAAELLDLPGAPWAALGYFVCALREAFEEVGWLPAGGLSSGLQADAGETEALLERCLADGIVLRTGALVPAGRWITPHGSPVRFDARFFAAGVDGEWTPRPDPREVASCRFVAPAAALGELAAGRALMAPPTVDMLQRLGAYGSVNEVLASLRAGPQADRVRGPLSARLSPLVHVIVAPNPGLMTGPGTNTYVLGANPSVIVDPAIQDEPYLAAVLGVAGDVAAIAVTHRHADHLGGVAALVEATGAPVRAFGSADADGIRVEPLADGDSVSFGGGRAQVLYTPGHASDHLALFVEPERALVCGDSVLGEGTAVIAPPDGDMGDYLDTLERLAALDATRIYPGHFRALEDARSVIEGYVEHRREREAAVAAAVRVGAATLDEIVAAVYRDTPAELHPVARHSALAHLELLERAGTVVQRQERFFPNDVD